MWVLCLHRSPLSLGFSYWSLVHTQPQMCWCSLCEGSWMPRISSKGSSAVRGAGMTKGRPHGKTCSWRSCQEPSRRFLCASYFSFVPSPRCSLAYRLRGFHPEFLGPSVKPHSMKNLPFTHPDFDWERLQILIGAQSLGLASIKVAGDLPCKYHFRLTSKSFISDASKEGNEV